MEFTAWNQELAKCVSTATSFTYDINQILLYLYRLLVVYLGPLSVLCFAVDGAYCVIPLRGE